MTAAPPRSRAGTALVTAVATALHYAMPDLIGSRTARGWAKAGLSSLAVAAAVPELRSAVTAARELQASGDGSLGRGFRALSAQRRAVALAPLVAMGVGAGAGVVAGERWAFRRGEARAAAGKRLPHTGPALVYGALAGAVWLLPDPPVGGDASEVAVIQASIVSHQR